MPYGPRFFKWRIVRLSGPAAMEFFGVGDGLFDHLVGERLEGGVQFVKLVEAAEDLSG